MKLVVLMMMLVVVCVNESQSQSCACDLTTNLCDLNCCCDDDCTQDDKLTFSACFPTNENRIEEVCLSDNVLFSSNGKYQAQGNGGGLFCIYKDNYEARYSYSSVPFASTQASFQQLSPSHTTTFAPKSIQGNQNVLESYKAGNALSIIFDDGREGFLPQPTTFLTNECEDQIAARFLFSNTTSCTRSLNDIKTQCQSQQWNGLNYYTGFKITPFPFTTNNSALLTPSLTLPVKCFENGFTVACPTNTVQKPNWNGTHCNNIMLHVEYELKYNINKTVGISQVDVSFVLGSLSKDVKSFEQTFSYKFNEDKTVDPNATITRKSGNPGYIVGLPIIIGDLDVDSITLVESINISSQPLQVIQSTQNGICPSEESMTPRKVEFGIDYQAGCFLSFSQPNTLLDCQKLQQDIYSILVSKLPTHIASFGNSLSQQPRDWVKVLNVQSTSEPSLSNGYCSNIVTDVLFQFLHAKTGYFVNPQSQIVGFEVQYGKGKDLKPKCFSLFCESVNRVLITQAISFVDVSTTPVNKVKPKPKFRSKAPNDFFYPFL